RIMDTGFSQFLLMPFVMMAMEYDGPDGSMKNAEVGGLQAKVVVEKEDGKVTETQVMVLVSERILVNGEGNEFATLDDVKAYVEKIDLKKLAALAAKQKAE
ncbi:MAG: hypothetical protein KKA42_05990, partial [candidate division Zixibacteria bacterium]|nr:hypothetical protein [candidate division Zixibacteria bacterium]